MSQSDELVSKTLEMQQNTIENGQRALRQAVEFPLEQTVQFQKSAAELFLNGLEIGTWAQRRGMDMTSDAVRSYISTVENTFQDAEQATEQGIRAMRPETGQAGQQPQGQQPQGPVTQPPQQRVQQPTQGPVQQPPQGPPQQPPQGPVQQPPSGQVPGPQQPGQQQPVQQQPIQRQPIQQPPTRQQPTQEPPVRLGEPIQQPDRSAQVAGQQSQGNGAGGTEGDPMDTEPDPETQ